MRKMISLRLWWIGLVMASCVIFAVQAHAQAISALVVPDDQPTIQGAIDIANPGTTIVIRAGTYRESIVIRKDNLRLVPEQGLGSVIIDGSVGVGAGVHGIHLINADRVEIRGLVIQHFDDFIGPGPLDYRSGLFIENGRGNIIGHNIFRFNGDNLALVSSDNNTIVGNDVHGAKHNGILLSDGSDNNTVRDNVSHDNDPRPVTVPPNLIPGCGVHISRSSTDNVVQSNDLFRNGRGIMIDRDSNANQIIGNVVYDNLRYGIVTFAEATFPDDPPARDNVITDNVTFNNGFHLVKNQDGELLGDGGFEEAADLYDELATDNNWDANIAEVSNVGGVEINCAVKGLCHNSGQLLVR